MLALTGAAPTPQAPAEMIADTGYHSRAALKALENSAWTTPISEKQQKGFARWHGDGATRRAVYNSRTRLKSRVARTAFKLRGEKVERSFAHILDVGALRRTWLRGVANVEKRYTIQGAAYNPGLVMRHRFGAGTPFGGGGDLPGGGIARKDGGRSDGGAPPRAKTPPPSGRKPGKQPGAKGTWRDAPLKTERTQSHWPAVCAQCGTAFEMWDAVVRTAEAVAVLES